MIDPDDDPTQSLVDITNHVLSRLDHIANELETLTAAVRSAQAAHMSSVGYGHMCSDGGDPS
jgi:hypothetical protein